MKITQVKDFYKFSHEIYPYKNPRTVLKKLSFIDTYMDNPGGRRVFFVAHNDYQMHGVLAFSHQDTKHKWLLTTVSVLPTSYGNGISSALFEKLIERSIKNKKVVINTDYTEDGALYFKPHVDKIIEKIKMLFPY